MKNKLSIKVGDKVFVLCFSFFFSCLVKIYLALALGGDTIAVAGNVGSLVLLLLVVPLHVVGDGLALHTKSKTNGNLFYAVKNTMKNNSRLIQLILRH